MNIKFDKYEKLGDYHWKLWQDGKNQYAQHARHCASLVKERPCLDMGCGDGLITSLLGDNASGIDNSELAVSLARSHKVNASAADACIRDVTRDGQYSSILMADLIEHLPNPGAALQNARCWLKPSGMLYISTPPRKETLQSEYHVREYSPEELAALVSGHGFELRGKVEVRMEWVEMYASFQMTR